MKSITSKDPRKAEIVATFKWEVPCHKVTQLKEDSSFIYGRCFRKIEGSRKYNFVGTYKYNKTTKQIESLFKTGSKEL